MKAANDNYPNKECYNMLKALIRKTERIEEHLAKIKLSMEVKDRSPWLTVEQAATYCGYHKNTFYSKYKNEIPHHQRNTRILFHIDDLEAWMNKSKKESIV